MKRILCQDYRQMSITAAGFISRQLKEKPNSVLGFATGSTPVGMYQELCRLFRAGLIDFSQATSFNLDEYYPMPKSHPQSYYSYMKRYLFDQTNFRSSFFLDGEATDISAACASYDQAIEISGGLDLQIIGIGVNGHIGFNEPADSYMLSTHLVHLSESTLRVNSRFFETPAHQPVCALTMGIRSIFSARKIIMLISGKSKAPLSARLFGEKLYTGLPASLLSLHPDTTVILDAEAAQEIK